MNTHIELPIREIDYILARSRDFAGILETAFQPRMFLKAAVLSVEVLPECEHRCRVNVKSRTAKFGAADGFLVNLPYSTVRSLLFA